MNQQSCSSAAQMVAALVGTEYAVLCPLVGKKAEDKMTPHDIRVLMHYQTCSGPHPNLDSIFVQMAIKTLLNSGLIYPLGERGAMYDTTEKGKTFVKSLCSVPVPAGDAN